MAVMWLWILLSLRFGLRLWLHGAVAVAAPVAMLCMWLRGLAVSVAVAVIVQGLCLWLAAVSVVVAVGCVWGFAYVVFPCFFIQRRSEISSPRGLLS